MPSLRHLSLLALGMGAAASPLGARQDSLSPDEAIRARPNSLAARQVQNSSPVDLDFATGAARHDSIGSSSPPPPSSPPLSPPPVSLRAPSNPESSILEEEERRGVDYVTVEEPQAPAPALSTATSTATSTSTSIASLFNSTDASSSPKKHFHPKGRKCGTAKPGAAILRHHHKLQLAQRSLDADQALAEARDVTSKPSSQKEKGTALRKRLQVKVYFHIVLTAADVGSVTKRMVANQLGQLQASYAAAGIHFVLGWVDWTVNDAWASDRDGDAMKRALRRGGYGDLNIYFQSALSSDGSGSDASMLLGYCTMPTQVTYTPCSGCAPKTFPPSAWSGDGCNVHAGSMPGGQLDGYNLGKTAVHEAGHWFGLLHTFEGETCDPNDPGDYIDDTPKESVSTDGCPLGKDSCTGPNCDGLDPIHNFMDYSDDACYVGFSPLQISRMQSMYTSLRQGN